MMMRMMLCGRCGDLSVWQANSSAVACFTAFAPFNLHPTYALEAHTKKKPEKSSQHTTHFFLSTSSTAQHSIPANTAKFPGSVYDP